MSAHRPRRVRPRSDHLPNRWTHMECRAFGTDASPGRGDAPMPRRALRSKLFLAVSLLLALLVMPPGPESYQSGLSSVKTVFVILFENTNWASVTPSVAPYIRTTVVPMGAHATQYFNPPGNHPSEPNYIWLEAGHHL